MIIAAIFYSSATYSVEVIVNPSVEADLLTTAQLRRIYTMRQVSWPDGSPIVVFVLPSKNQTHQRFSKEVLRLFPYQLDRIWNKLIFTGLGLGPNIVDSKALLIMKVASVRGAIGYVDNIEEGGDVNLIKIKE